MKEMETQSKTSLKLQAYQYLKTKILNCEYRPNEFLNEQKLCAEMGNISRTPMRDALGRLEQEGLITILPKKGLMVSGITEEDVHSMFEMRLLVEPYALRTGQLFKGGFPAQGGTAVGAAFQIGKALGPVGAGVARAPAAAVGPQAGGGVVGPTPASPWPT